MASILNMMLQGIFLFLLLLFSVDAGKPLPYGCPAAVQGVKFTKMPMDNVIFTQNIILETSAKSKLECTRNCVAQNGCHMLTFLPEAGSSSGTCRTYSKVLSLSDSTSNATGAYNYRLQALDGYSWQCGRFLRVIQEDVTYPEAVGLCCQTGQADLVMPKTVQDRDCVHKLKKDLGRSDCWVGADDLKTEGQYKWRDGTALDSNSPLWDLRQPDGPGHYTDCVAILASGKLHDIGCSTRALVICQKS